MSNITQTEFTHISNWLKWSRVDLKFKVWPLCWKSLTRTGFKGSVNVIRGTRGLNKFTYYIGLFEVLLVFHYMLQITLSLFLCVDIYLFTIVLKPLYAVSFETFASDWLKCIVVSLNTICIRLLSRPRHDFCKVY